MKYRAILVWLFRTLIVCLEITLLRFSYASGEITFSDIQDNVCQNEVLYKNIEVILHATYHTAPHDPLDDADLLEILSRDSRIRSISQDGMFRVDSEGTKTNTEGKHPFTNTRQFDGTTTRAYRSRSHAGNIISGRADDADFLRPHMLLLPYNMLMVPLSTYMQGHEAMSAHPTGGWDRGLIMVNTYQGEAVFEGLKCHKIWLTTAIKKTKTPYSRWELWLAENRNYMPVRCLAYTFKFSKTEPIGEAQVDEWHEIEPAIWYPKQAHYIAYDKLVLADKQKQQMRWRKDFTVEYIKLNPNYDIDFFRDVEFPDGTAVYETENGKRIRSYRVGVPDAPGGPTANVMGRWRFPLILSAALAILCAVFVTRRIRRQKAAS